jgi:CHAT domain-containing protein
MFVASSDVRRSRLVFRGAALIIAAVLVGGDQAAGRQRSKTPTYEAPAGMRKERLARELAERRERQLRAGLADEAAESAKQLEEMIRAQDEQCRGWWEIQDLALRGGRLTKEQTKLLLKSASQLGADCYWRPGVPSSLLADGDDPVERPTDRDLTGMQLANELSGRLMRALLFVEPVLATTIDPDLINPMTSYMSVATTSPEFARMMKDVGRLSTSQADQAEADTLLQQMLVLTRRLVPPNPGATLFVTGMRRGYSELRGDTPAALNQAREEVAFLEAQFGGNSIQLCPPLWQLASLLMSSGQREHALESANRCLGLASSRSSSLTYATALNNLGVIYHRSGAIDRALDAYQKSLAVYERNAVALQDRFTAAQDPVLQVHANLGLTYWRSGAVPQAYRHLQLARERMLTEGTSYITERGVIASMAQLSAELDVFLTVERAVPPSPDRTTLALPLLLERKSLALGTKATTLTALANEPAQLREYRRLLAYRSSMARTRPAAADEREKQRQTAREVDLQIQTLEANAKQQSLMATGATAAPPDPRVIEYSKEYSKAVAKLTEKRYKNPPKDDRRSEMEVMMDLQRQAEAEIAPRFKDYLEAQQRAGRGNRETLIKRIQAALPETAALVEMVRFRPFDAAAATPGERWAPPRYGAYVIRRSGEPTFVDWGDAAPIDELIVEFRRTLSQPRGTLARDLGRRLDAALMQPMRPALGSATLIYLSPDGALNLVPFGALVDEQDRYLVETVTFNYVSSGRDLMRTPSPAPTARGAAVVVANPAFDPGGAATGAAPTRSALGNHFEPLPGTAAEAEAIKSLLAGARVFTGDQATETALKSVVAPRVLHVATHGFFLEDQDLAAATAPGSAATVEDPMLRSGLVFAGANAGRSGADDGVLTALEAAALDLGGTELVVLSACETGVGDVRTGEGVFGLRRAFMVAGAETLVMSLWQVDDDATKRLMEEFYGRLAKGEGRAEALRQASIALLRDPARRHPFYWASFISTGEAGRMRR